MGNLQGSKCNVVYDLWLPHIWLNSRYLLKYKETLSHIWLCTCSLPDFLIYEENFTPVFFNRVGIDLKPWWCMFFLTFKLLCVQILSDCSLYQKIKRQTKDLLAFLCTCRSRGSRPRRTVQLVLTRGSL
jgi:hypothetical protein